MSYTPSAFPVVRLRIASPFFLLILLATSAFGQQPQVLLGKTNVGSSLGESQSGTAKAFRVQAVATGQVDSLSVYLDSSNGAPTVWVGMYTSHHGHPQTLLSKGVISNPVAGQWNSVSLPPAQVDAGATYWLALLGVDGVVQFRDRYAMCRPEVDSQTSLSSLPATWTTGSRWPTCIASMFETGSVATGGTATPNATVSISPHSISLQAGQQQQFAAVVSGLNNPAVRWTASGGNINNAGLFTAPTSAGSFTVMASALTSRRRSNSTVVASDSALVTVTLPNPPPPITGTTQVSVSPTAASLQTGGHQQFTAAVSGSSNTAVTWSASGGTISASGQYTAPATAGTYTITALSNADTTKSASALVIVSVPQTVAIAVSPANASVGEANQVQFTAAVSGLSNTAVTWAVTRGSGTISQSGLYTAPRAAESDVITATSQADNTKSANASLTVLPPHSVSLNWSASPSTDVASYRVYRGTVSGGPYNVLTTNVKANTYTDSTVQSGGTYYYVTSAVDTAGAESIFSNEFQSVIPSP
jgi:hypothetical protein